MRAVLPEAYAVHQTADRLRIRIPSRKGDRRFFSAVGERLSALDGVDRLEVNPMTGGVLIRHNLGPEAISRYAEEQRLFALGDGAPSPASAAAPAPRQSLTAIGQLYARYDRGLRRLTGERLDLPSVAVLGFGLAGVVQLMRGNVAAPAWYTGLWYAMNIFLKARPGEDAGE